MRDPRLASSDFFADSDRLNAQVHLTWSKEFGALKALGLRDGMSILELGAGPGVVTELLAQLFPNSSIVAVELDPVMVDHAKRRLAKYIPQQVQILQESALYTTLPDDTFDFAIVRFLLQHLSSPKMALEEARRLLKPGGVVSAIDTDDGLGGIIYSKLNSIGLVMARLRELQARNGGDRLIGRKLWRLTRDAGFEQVKMDSIVVQSDEVGLEPFVPQYHPDRFFPLVSIEGGLSQQEWEQYKREYEDFIKTDSSYILNLLFMVSGRKP